MVKEGTRRRSAVNVVGWAPPQGRGRREVEKGGGGTRTHIRLRAPVFRLDSGSELRSTKRHKWAQNQGVRPLRTRVVVSSGPNYARGLRRECGTVSGQIWLLDKASIQPHLPYLPVGRKFSITQTSHASGDPDANAIRRPSGWSLR